MAINVKRSLKNENQRNYLAKDFESFRNELYKHAKLYFSNKIQDFSEASLGGLLLDMAAFVGDTMSFYLDHQFNELNWSSAIEVKNIQKHLRNAGVKVHGATPSVVMVKVYFEVPAETINGSTAPKVALLPKVGALSIFTSNDGIPFNLLSDLDFAEKDKDGNFLYESVVVETDDAGTPTSYVIMRDGLCLSGVRKEWKTSIPNIHKAFRTLTLPDENVTDIVSVKDSDGNIYYEVESLSQDTVFKKIINLTEDSDSVGYNLEVIPAPYRFVRSYDYNTKLTTIRFGSGNAKTLDNDIIPDPSELALPLYGKTTFSRFTIDPNAMLQTQTLGISPRNTTLTITYRAGGGLKHNVGAESIRTVSTLFLKFSSVASASEASLVRGSIDCSNKLPALDGDRAPTISELRALIPSSRAAQSRIITKEDLIARIYTLPNQFGRVYRVGIRPNPINSLASQIFIVSRNKRKKLKMSSDTLKKNLRIYLNEFRAVSDAYDILDARIINFAVNVDIVAHPDSNKSQVAQKIINNLTQLLKTDNFQIDMPIAYADLINSVLNSEGVISMVDIKLVNLTGVVEERTYSDVSFSVDGNTFQQMVVGPPGSIFELKYPNKDIIVTVR
tara:strand:- start:7688 stop:9532 length:1845 start_codon:yes stop_codon:yes gene_type:complete